mgnify:CR=1 FL=1
MIGRLVGQDKRSAERQSRADQVRHRCEQIVADQNGPYQFHAAGIGAGPGCDGQVLVCNDMLGMDLTFKPRFVKHYAELDNTIRKAMKQYVSEVKGGAFPTPEHSFS